MVEGQLIAAFGYKSHINIDRRFRLIQRFIVTDAARHDGAQLPGVGDKAYRSKANEAAIAAECMRRPEAAYGAVHSCHRPRAATVTIGFANLAYNFRRLT